ncbi:Protein DENND6B [Trichinella patagoniensis]|uniref:Protein DENND6B n=1 Tax=Trichinella patagoniensis TaxID=990121 RepID=A0A0V0ZUI9_9BILA|nr:Protein DENND6B [Trichinella patagoniensis]
MQHDCLLLYISSVPDNSGVYFKNLNNWVHCFCALTFDLEVGQSLETVLAIRSFISEFEDLLEIDPDYFFGFVFFRQVKDSSLPRVSQEMNHWEPPVPGALLNLPLMGSVIKMNESCYTLLNVYEPDLYEHHVILGTTNLYFIKAMENWPHVLRLSTDSKRKGTGAHKIRRHIGLKGMEEKSGKCYFNFMAASIEINMNFKGIHTNRPKEAQSMMIRRHFMDLTHSFLFPLEQYVANTMPLQKDISPWKDAPRLREFDKEEFLKFVENADLPSRTGIKGDWINLYRLFCDTKTFTYWLKQRQTEVNTRLRMLHLEALAGATVDCTLQSKIEVEVVDFILKLRDALVFKCFLFNDFLSFAESHRELVNDELLCRVNDHYRKALQYVREDLRSLLDRE